MSIDVAASSDGSVLSDGTRLDDLFDHPHRRISARVFSDPEIFEWEMSRIFTRSWLFLGLESEIPEPGDYVVRPMGGDSVIVTRDSKAEISVLLNRCTHRGTQLCVNDCGRAQRFRCPYHGWLFTSDGSLAAMPDQRDWLGAGTKAEYAMRTARVATRGGLIFATWDDDMPDFETYLGDFAFYFDMMLCSTDEHLVAVGAPQRWAVPFNWKLGAENFVGDGYHLQTAHRSLTDLGLTPLPDLSCAAVGSVPRWGHGFFSMFPPPASDALPLEFTLAFLPPEVLPQLERHLNAEQMELARAGSFPMVVTVFPNLSWLSTPFGFFLRVWQPTGPGEIELWTWALAHPDATPEQRRSLAQGVNRTFGATGLFEQDDTAIWSRVQRAHEGVMARHEFVSYGCTGGDPDDTWRGPGHVWTGFSTDDHLWNFHLRWLHLMTGGAL